MKNFIFTALKIFFYLILFLLVAAGVFFLVTYMGWPLWVGGAILVGVFGIIFGVLFFRRWLFRRREKKFVKRVIDEDKERIQAGKEIERASYLDLEDRWLRAIQILKNASLKGFGNPMYALPWYMVLGAPGSGKSAALRSARLRAPVTEVSPPQTEAPTRNLDFLFLDDAVILDTAGRYATAVNQNLNKDEWQDFLTLLARYRKREPLSGFVLTVGADMLLSDDVDALVDYAKNLRRRLDEIMRALGARIPVYLLVTKTDKIPGMLDFFSHFPDAELLQAFGELNVSQRKSPEMFIEESLQSLGSRLKDLRLWFAERHAKAPARMVIFPDAFEGLKPGMRRFVDILFDRNLFQETPFLRGVYFSSGIQDGTEVGIENFASMSAFPPPPKSLAKADQGFFLHELFTSILPSDRKLYAPLYEFRRWRELTHGLAIASVLAVLLCFCGLITFSYLKNSAAILEFTEDFRSVPRLGRDLKKNLLLMDSYRQELIHMSTLNQDWVLPRMGYDQSLVIQKKLETMYTDMFREGLLNPLNARISYNIADLSDSSDDQDLIQYIAHLVSRISLLDTALSNKSKLSTAKLLDERVFTLLDKELIPQMAEYFNENYIEYLQLTDRKASIERERVSLMLMLRDVLQAKRTELDWLVDWANESAELHPVSIEDYWGLTTIPHDAGYEVPPAFTVKGRQKIQAFIKQIQSVLGQSYGIQDRITQFRDRYASQYVSAWENFALSFPDGALWERNYEEWKRMSRTMSELNNPYFDAIAEISEQMAPYSNLGVKYAWIDAVMNFEQLKANANAKTVSKAEESILSKIQTGVKAVEELTKSSGSDDKSAAGAAKERVSRTVILLQAASSYENYIKNLQQLTPATLSDQAALTMAANFFASGGKPTESKSPLHLAYISLLKMLKQMKADVPGSEPFHKLVSGPLDYLLEYTMLDAAHELQEQWESVVLAAIAAAPSDKRASILFDEKKGVVWKFVNGPAAPFVGRNEYGYFALESAGQKVPFEDAFFRFIEQGNVETQIIQPKYEVKVNALPTDANEDAHEDPYATILTLDCGKGGLKLENYNYPANMTYAWEPEKCGDTTFTIRFSQMDLTMKYPGPMGFPKFLEEFRYGSKAFTPEDFPDHTGDLEAINIKKITVNYEFEGNTPVIKLLFSRKPDVPRVITHSFLY